METGESSKLLPCFGGFQNVYPGKSRLFSAQVDQGRAADGTLPDCLGGELADLFCLHGLFAGQANIPGEAKAFHRSNDQPAQVELPPS